MRLPLLFTPFLLIAMTPLSSWASNELGMATDFSNQAEVLAANALGLGYREFGQLNLYDFLSRLREVRVTVKGAVNHRQKLGGFTMERDGAQWESSRGGSIAISGERWPKVPRRAKPMLALHESLGALGYHDDDFGCSSFIWTLSNPKVRATFTQEELSHFEAGAQRGCLLARGGSTGVTGGGDDYNVLRRIEMVESNVKRINPSSTREEREAAISDIQHSLINRGYGIRRRGPGFTAVELSMNIISLQGQPNLASVRVFQDLEETIEIPRNTKNGWVYHVETNTIRITGRYQVKGAGNSPVVRYGSVAQ